MDIVDIIDIVENVDIVYSVVIVDIVEIVVIADIADIAEIVGILDIADICGNQRRHCCQFWHCENLYICTLEQFETMLGSVCSNLKNVNYLVTQCDLRDASASKNSTIDWIYGISKNTLGSQRSQKILWDLLDLKKYFGISKYL